MKSKARIIPMDITEWYAAVIGCTVALLVIASLLLLIFKVVRNFSTFGFLKHVYYPQVHKYLRGSQKTTRFDAALITAFLVGNVLCTAIQVNNTSDLARRSGLLAVINLMPLATGAHMNLIADSCGITLGAYGRIHRWIGRVAIAEALIHMAAKLPMHTLNFQALTDVGGLTAIVTMAVILLFSAASLRRRFYELFHKLHLGLAVVLIAAVYIHSKSEQLLLPPNVYLLAALSLQTLTGVLRLGLVSYRSIKRWKQRSRATVRTITFKRGFGRDIPLSDAVHVHVRLARPWKRRAGQYVYLCLPDVSRTSMFQSHPFYVSWWYRKRGNDYAVFIVQKRKGFTKNLFLCADSHPGDGSENEDSRIDDSGMMALVEGPYGKELNLESYGTVLLFATDIGIAGQLPYVTQLLEGYQNCEVKTRRIALFWEVNSELHVAWVGEMMKELLSRDTDRILDIRLFVIGRFLSINTNRGDTVQPGERLRIAYQAMDAESLIHSEIEDRKGRTVVSLCTNDETSDKIRHVVGSMLDKDIRLEELDYRPGPPPENTRPAKDMFALKRIKSKLVTV